jgi:hypothetical protein
MFFCNKHKNILFRSSKKITKICEKHGQYETITTFLKEPCLYCAKEKNICQVCGEKINLKFYFLDKK